MSIEKNIIKSICYFDIFDYPLTLPEIHQWLFQIKTNLSDLKSVFEQSEFLKEKIGQKDGFYFLNGREEIIEIRKKRKEISEKKIKRAKKICKWLLFFNPFVKGVAVCNDLAYFNAPENSDIDLFIITQKNSIWAARFFLVFSLKLFGLRPTEKNKKDKICLSFFISEDNLNLEKIVLPEKEGVPDIYFIYWMAQLMPIYAKSNIWRNFYQANNWLKKYLANFIPRLSAEFPPTGGGLECPQSHFVNSFSEKFYRWPQLKILPKNLKEKANQDAGVIINDKMLKFHNPDKREFYRREFFRRITRIDK